MINGNMGGGAAIAKVACQAKKDVHHYSSPRSRIHHTALGHPLLSIQFIVDIYFSRVIIHMEQVILEVLQWHLCGATSLAIAYDAIHSSARL